jgi:hypothetical protein
MSTYKITNVGEPTNAQDMATRNYVDSILACMILSSQLILFTRTANGPLQVKLNDTAGSTLKLVNTLTAITTAAGVESHSSRSTCKSTHITSANDDSDSRNRQ